MKKKAVFVIAHPDDELICFGAALLKLKTKYNICVILAVNPGIERYNNFEMCMDELECECYCLNLPDKEEIITMEVCNKLSQIIRDTNPDLVITHDPFMGDLGCHEAHKQIAIATGHLTYQLFPDIPIWFLYSQGAARFVYTATINKNTFKVLLELINKYYKDQLLYLEPEIYPIKTLNSFVSIEPDIIDALMLRLLSEEIQPNDLEYLVSDPWFTKTSRYEIKKAQHTANTLITWVKDYYQPLHEEINIVDVGSGYGAVLQNLLHIKNFKLTAVESTKYYHKSLQHITGKNRVFDSIDNISSPVNILMFIESIYYFNPRKIYKILTKTNPDYIFLVNYTDKQLDWFLENSYFNIATNLFSEICLEEISKTYSPIIIEEIPLCFLRREEYA